MLLGTIWAPIVDAFGGAVVGFHSFASGSITCARAPRDRLVSVRGSQEPSDSIERLIRSRQRGLDLSYSCTADVAVVGILQ